MFQLNFITQTGTVTTYRLQYGGLKDGQDIYTKLIVDKDKALGVQLKQQSPWG